MNKPACINVWKLAFWRVLASCLVLITNGVNASSIVSVDSNAQFHFGGQSNFSTDGLIVGLPNEAHISFNDFSDFIVDQPLQIFNLPSADQPAADTIVIYADTITLSNTLEIIGPPTDLILVKKETSSATEQMVCQNCEFKNVNRVVMANAVFYGVQPSQSLSSIDQFMTQANRHIVISNLSAPGAISVDILSETLELTGEINLNQTLTPESMGGYDVNINGSTTVGTGSAALYLGWLTWNYTDRDVVAVTGLAPKSTLNGKIKAPAVRIASTGMLDLHSQIDTRTNLLATVMYQGALNIVEESILVHLLHEQAGLYVTSSYDSDASIDFHTAADLKLSGSSRLNAPEVQLVVGKELINYGRINADRVYLAADKVDSQGDVLATSVAQLYGKSSFLNRYGGNIQARKIVVESDGLVRNGSKTPYQNNNESTALIGYSNDLLDALANQDISAFDVMSLGTFYDAATNVDINPANYVMAPDTTASIIGGEVQIKGSAVENINPYYEFANENGVIEYKRDKATQIAMIAERYLTVNGAQYILNSSAVMQVNSESGLLTLDTALVNNERYRLESGVTKSVTEEDLVLDIGYGILEFTVGETLLGSEFSVASPPGRIVSMGDFYVSATQSVLNNTAYIEIFGDAQLTTPSVNSLGVNQFIYGATSHTYQNGLTTPLVASSEYSDEFDTLFFVQGNLVAPETTAWHKNHEPINLIISQTVDLLVEEDLPDLDVTEEPVVTLGNYSYHHTVNHSIIDQNELAINWATEETGFTYSFQGGSLVGGSFHIENEGTETYSLFDALKRYYESVVASLQGVIAEIDFWNN